MRMMLTVLRLNKNVMTGLLLHDRRMSKQYNFTKTIEATEGLEVRTKGPHFFSIWCVGPWRLTKVNMRVMLTALLL